MPGSSRLFLRDWPWSNIKMKTEFTFLKEFKEVCKNLNKEQIEATFKKFDQTGNDKLSFREFRDMMTRDKGKGKGKAGKQQAVGSTDQLEAKETKGAKEAKEAKEMRRKRSASLRESKRSVSSQ